LILSSQTKDEITFRVMQNLMRNGSLTIDFFLSHSLAEIKQSIDGIGLINKKAEYLQKLAIMLRNEYSDVIPTDYETLLKLPGVGPKNARQFLTYV